MNKKFLNESTTSIDIAGVNLKVSDLIHRVYTEPLVSRIGAKINVKVPKGSIFALETIYQTNAQGVDKTGTGYGVVESDFAGPDQEISGVKANVLHRIKKREISCKTKAIRSAWTIEALTDWISITSKEDVEELISKELITEVIQEIDATALKLLAQKGSKITINADLSLGKSFVGVEIFNKLQTLALNMTSNIKRVITICITANPNIVGVLMSHPNFVANTDFSNGYFMGTIGATEIYCDPYSTKTGDYAFITYKERVPNETADASIVYAFLSYTLQKGVDAYTGDNAYIHYTRYDITQHPSDDINDGASKFIIDVNIQNGGAVANGGQPKPGSVGDGGII